MSATDPSLEPFDPRALVPVHRLPEGIAARSPIGRFLWRLGDSAYDALWRYVRKVDRRLHAEQQGEVRIDEFAVGLRNREEIPTRIDFAEELVFHGRKLTIPFGSIRGLVAALGLLPDRPDSVDLLLKADGSDLFLPLHRFAAAAEITELGDFLSKRMRVPLGLLVAPLELWVRPGGARLRHADEQIPLHEVRGITAMAAPGDRTRIRLLRAPGDPIELFDGSDPGGRLAAWGTIADELLSVVARRVRSRYRG